MRKAYEIQATYHNKGVNRSVRGAETIVEKKMNVCVVAQATVCCARTPKCPLLCV